MDLSIGLALQLLSIEGCRPFINKVKIAVTQAAHGSDPLLCKHFEIYHATISPAIRFLQGRDPSLAHRIASGRYCPEGPRFAALNRYVDNEQGADALDWAFGALDCRIAPSTLQPLYINDLGDVIRDAADPRFEFVPLCGITGGQPADVR